MDPKIIARIDRYCAYQERCRSEVIAKMIELGLTSNQRMAILIRLEEEGFVNEERYIYHFIRGKFSLKKWGKNKIKAHLLAKRLPELLIDQHLKILEEEKYLEQIELLIDQKWERIKEENLFIKKDKIYKFLLNKGYEPDKIWEILKTKTDSITNNSSI
ncbi:MAG: RecX family transcriptional regulator [Chitinophagales bacterium]|nr:RecX family transcriptional regulator [Chitinophagales bacterium]